MIASIVIDKYLLLLKKPEIRKYALLIPFTSSECGIEIAVYEF